MSEQDHVASQDAVRCAGGAHPEGAEPHIRCGGIQIVSAEVMAELLASVDAAKAQRAEEMPDEAAALQVLFRAYQRLQELGFSDAIYCPKDGTVFDVIEAGSTGIHDCTYEGEWPRGRWWVLADGDMWPSRPILYRRKAAVGVVPSATPPPGEPNG